MTRKKNKDVTSTDAATGLPGLPHGALADQETVHIDDDFTILGEADAQKPADAQQTDGAADEKTGGAAPGADGAVEDDDRGTAETDAAEHAGKQAGADQPDTDGGLSDEKQAEQSREIEPSADAASAETDGAGGADVVDAADGAGEGEPAQSNDADGSADGPAVAMLDEGVDAGAAHGLGAAPDLSGEGQAATPASDGAVYTAVIAAYQVFDYINKFYELPHPVYDRCHILIGQDMAAVNAVAALKRKIGRDRATAAVAASQLKILGIWDEAEAHPVEELILTVFVDVLSSIDSFDAAEAKRLEQLLAKPRDNPPVPIEETTLEMVDGPMETWR